MAHYYDRKQDSPLSIDTVEVVLLGSRIKLHTSGGVFSKGRVDRGSEILIDNAVIHEGSRILDIGCGYGVVGIAIAKRYNAKVVMSDVNERAVMLSVKNAKMNNVNADILQSDGYSNIEGTFDAILLNPPQSAGKKICFALIDNAPAFLNGNGTLQLVARNQKGGKELKKRMNEAFGNAETIARESGYHVYLSRKE